MPVSGAFHVLAGGSGTARRDRPAPTPAAAPAPAPGTAPVSGSTPSVCLAHPRPSALSLWRPSRTGRCLAAADHVLLDAKALARLSGAVFLATMADAAERIRRGRTGPADLRRALALAHVVAERRIGLTPYRVQVAAALAGLDGHLIEMATGEGKSLVAAMIAAVAGWRGAGVHVLTVNDYLAERDAERFRPLFAELGLSVATVLGPHGDAARRRGYAAGITYLTAREAAADHLRGRLALGDRAPLPLLPTLCHEGASVGDRAPVQRGLACAIVDEADALLIDEATTPLVLSGEAPPSPEEAEDIRHADRAAATLRQGVDFRIDHQDRDVLLTPSGEAAIEALLAPVGGVWRSARYRSEAVARALSARHLFLGDRHYVVQDGKVVIVDEATGRLMPDRSWRDGLHQAVEAKEGVPLTPRKRTLARLPFQRFFARYRHLTGLTGTAAEASAELKRVYGLSIVRIPTRLPVRRDVLPTRVHRSDALKWVDVVREVMRVHLTGRPVLIGTRTVAASLDLSRRLADAGLPHAVLNAVNHAEEAAIVAAAGQVGAITVATNMAGRGTDIALGPGVGDRGGLHVIATERHTSARVDRQLIGRAARQGDPGSAVFILSTTDELVALRTAHDPVGRVRLALSPLDAFERAQRAAERMARLRRLRLMADDRRLDEQLGFAGREEG